MSKITKYFRSYTAKFVYHQLNMMNITSTQEEADTRLLLHAADAAANGCQKVDHTDVLVLSVALFSQMNLSELRLAYMEMF